MPLFLSLLALALPERVPWIYWPVLIGCPSTVPVFYDHPRGVGASPDGVCMCPLVRVNSNAILDSNNQKKYAFLQGFRLCCLSVLPSLFILSILCLFFISSSSSGP